MEAKISVLTPEPKAVYHINTFQSRPREKVSVLTPEPKAVYPNLAPDQSAMVEVRFSAHP